MNPVGVKAVPNRPIRVHIHVVIVIDEIELDRRAEDHCHGQQKKTANDPGCVGISRGGR